MLDHPCLFMFFCRIHIRAWCGTDNHLRFKQSSVPRVSQSQSFPELVRTTGMHGMLRVHQETFLNDYLLEKDYPLLSSKIKEFGTIFSQIETSNYRKYNDTGKGNETRTAEFGDICTTLPQRNWSFESYWWNLFLQWCGGLSERFPISEMHPGTFQNSMEFQSWKVNFETEVCANTVFPRVTMHWIKEVEIAKSIDDLTTPRSITGTAICLMRLLRLR